MSSWNSLSINFDPFGPLKPPLKSFLTVLETIEATLEALQAVIRSFSLDFLNPLKATVAVILAAVRSIINQLKSTGFSILLVHPDFSQPDFGAVLQSVSGAYPGFESKVVSKFYDTADIFRPAYPSGSAVAMFVFYIGAESPGDLLSQLFALLSFIKHPQILTGLPAPVNLKARPVDKSGAAISRFKKLFSSDLEKALELEWQMPMAPAGGTAPGFVNSLVSFYDSFRFPNFVVERSTEPQGKPIVKTLKTQTAGKIITNQQKRFNFAKPETDVSVQEVSGTVFRHFEKKYPVNNESGLLEGQVTGTYRFLDKDFTDADRGKNFYYRIRAYFGTPTDYLGAKVLSDYDSLLKEDRNRYTITYGDSVTMGNPSAIARGFLPRIRRTSDGVFNLYEDINRAVQAGLLLNFEFPHSSGPVGPTTRVDSNGVITVIPATPGDSDHRKKQKTGWGTLSLVGGQIGPLKSAYKTSTELKSAFLFQTTARRISNQCAVALYSNPALADLVASKWVSGASEAVDKILSTSTQWGFVGITGGITNQARDKIEAYLSLEDSYQEGYQETHGPYPLMNLDEVSRQSLSDFLRLSLVALSGQSKYLSWYSVTIGDVLPAFVPFIFDFEQFLLALLGAVKSALEELENMIATVISKIEQLESVLHMILSLLDLLKIKVSVSVLATANTNGSASSLAQALLTSQDKPGDKPFGLHSGMVLTAGGPGEASVAALKAIAYILQIPMAYGG